MNRTITLPELAEAIASATEISKAESEAFLKDLFALIGERLAEHDDVTVKGLGRFVVIDGEPSFCPDSEFSDGVNQAFAAFEAIELGDDITPDMLESTLSPNITTDEQIPIEDDQPEENTLQSTDVSESEPIIEPEMPIEEAIEKSEISTPESDESDANEPDDIADEHINTEEMHNEEDQYTIDNSHSFKLLLTILLFIFWGVGCFIAGYIISPLHGDNANDEDDEIEAIVSDTVDSIVVVADSVAVTDTTKAEALTPVIPTVKASVVTDTVKTNRYLTTMARDHYGLMDFWVYIYEENANILGNPNRITPGTVVVIPPAEKYGIDRNNPESVRIAKLKSIEIYTPYKK